MHRFLLTPRWWAINAFVLLAIPFCLAMGAWQLDRFEDRMANHRAQQEQQATAGSAEPAPVETLLPPTTDTVGEQARVTGRYDADHEVLIPRRHLDGERGFYVLTPLRPTDGGPAVPVVRGWLPGDPDASAAPAAPDGDVTVVGALQAAESPRAVNAPSGLPRGQIGVIGAASLINVLPYEVEDAWITVRDAAEPLRAVPATAPSHTGLDLKAFQNLGYTAEWFVFVGFVVFMWYRLYRRELETQRDAPWVSPPRAAAEPAPEDSREDAAARTRSPAPPA